MEQPKTIKSEKKVKKIAEIVLYYATWCGYSKMFLPEWEKFEEYAKENFEQLIVNKIRCEAGNEQICFEKDITGYPTVILYLDDGSEKQFMYERTSEKLIKFVKEYIKNINDNN